MKIIFFGTPNFSSQILKEISKNNDILCVVTGEDSKQGRGKKIQFPDIKKTGIELGVPVLQPKNLKDQIFIKSLQNFNADVFLVIAFRKLPKEVWEIPKKGTINLHTSLLPEYRGAGPINWVLINGEKTTGVTCFYINEIIDQGNIITQKKINLDQNITAAQLHNQMIIDGIEIVSETIKQITEERINTIIQSENKDLKNAPKIHKELLRINWNEPINKIHNKIRGLSPYLDDNELLKDVSICPCAWFKLNNKRVKIQKTSICEVINNDSRIDTDNKNYLHINFKNKALALEMIQIEGKKPMLIKQFLQGNRINSSDKIS
ncbi:MAG: methionyl-tRNA formyltransferase [Flavobacteriales bacterium]|nr:methionyl-tRNA formyltransferase [Flavobacteriales bacterium]